MAKKARRKMEEAEEAHHFEFPYFDEAKFVLHELELSLALAYAFIITLALAVLSWAIDRWIGALLFIPILLGIGVIAFSPSVIQRLRPLAHEYTRGDWAGLIAVEVMGWLGLWFLLLNVAPV
ncbi:MAG TPA: hypothetical protein VFF67_04055 [Thermoplasmata archaeon]|nr:hypothetical protein [Thermoplasmata archaeon]